MTSLRQARVAVIAALLVAACGCGSNNSGGTDGSSSGSPDGGGVAVTCDPAAQTCGGGMQCDFFCDGTKLVVGCRADSGGSQDAGVACSATAPCARGSGCLTAAGSGASCKKYCASAADCPTGTCQPATIGVNCGAGTSTVTL